MTLETQFDLEDLGARIHAALSASVRGKPPAWVGEFHDVQGNLRPVEQIVKRLEKKSDEDLHDLEVSGDCLTCFRLPSRAGATLPEGLLLRGRCGREARIILQIQRVRSIRENSVRMESLGTPRRRSQRHSVPTLLWMLQANVSKREKMTTAGRMVVVAQRVPKVAAQAEEGSEAEEDGEVRQQAAGLCEIKNSNSTQQMQNMSCTPSLQEGDDEPPAQQQQKPAPKRPAAAAKTGAGQPQQHKKMVEVSEVSSAAFGELKVIDGVALLPPHDDCRRQPLQTPRPLPCSTPPSPHTTINVMKKHAAHAPRRSTWSRWSGA